MQAIAERGSFFFLPPFPFFVSCGSESRPAVSFIATFVPRRGIFRRGGLHLTNLGAASGTNCARPFGFAQGRPSALLGASTSALLGPGVAEGDCCRQRRDCCPDMRVLDDPRGGAGLTCLSVRCLSSYLIFSASSSDKQAAVRFAGARLDGLVRRP